MLVSFVLRLVPGALEQGRLVGEVEDVMTGARAPFADAAQLAAWCAARTGSAPAEIELPGPRPDVDLDAPGAPATASRGDRR